MSKIESWKQRIRAGEIITGVGASIDFTRTQLEDLLSKGSYDYVYIDGQHTPLDEQKLAAFCAMAEALDMPVHFRIPHTRHTYLIGRYLDLGPTGILVPEVSRVEEVEEAIAYFYYPQVGRRSWGGETRVGLRARNGTVSRLEYADWWNRTGVLGIQIESVEAVVRAGQLARAGVDLLSFGPNDLMFSIEAHPTFPFRTVDACIQHVAEQVQGTTTRLSVGAAAPGSREKYLEMGVTMFQESPPG